MQPMVNPNPDLHPVDSHTIDDDPSDTASPRSRFPVSLIVTLVIIVGVIAVLMAVYGGTEPVTSVDTTQMVPAT